MENTKRNIHAGVSNLNSANTNIDEQQGTIDRNEVQNTTTTKDQAAQLHQQKQHQQREETIKSSKNMLDMP